MFRYKTVEQEGQGEQTIEKSRFIGYVCPINNREEADEFFRKIRAKNREATHNVPVFTLGEKFEQQWASDDGEPQGTSGVPILQMMVKEGITNTAVVVTRYFGGIKLGTGGLVRAYTGTAKLALEAAGIHEVKEWDILFIELAYMYIGKLQNLEKEGIFRIADTIFTDKVTVEIHFEPEHSRQVKSMLSDMTAGNFQIEKEERKLV